MVILVCCMLFVCLMCEHHHECLAVCLLVFEFCCDVGNNMKVPCCCFEIAILFFPEIHLNVLVYCLFVCYMNLLCYALLFMCCCWISSKLIACCCFEPHKYAYKIHVKYVVCCCLAVVCALMPCCYHTLEMLIDDDYMMMMFVCCCF